MFSRPTTLVFATIPSAGSASTMNISRIGIGNAIRKSTNATTTAAAGTMSFGKYTLLIRFALFTTLFEASFSPLEKKVHA